MVLRLLHCPSTARPIPSELWCPPQNALLFQESPSPFPFPGSFRYFRNRPLHCCLWIKSCRPLRLPFFPMCDSEHRVFIEVSLRGQDPPLRARLLACSSSIGKDSWIRMPFSFPSRPRTFFSYFILVPLFTAIPPGPHHLPPLIMDSIRHCFPCSPPRDPLHPRSSGRHKKWRGWFHVYAVC